jgi:pilus assembly protein Flp/PilA
MAWVLMRFLFLLRFDRRGVTSIEYGLIAVIIIVAIVGGVTAIGKNLPGAFNIVSSEL